MIFIVCALHCEARPLVEQYRLVVDREASFPVFSSSDIVLVVSGIGKLNTASAMAYVYARYHEPVFSAWFNIGIAGIKNSTPGQLININKVTEASSGTSWYPVRLNALSEQPSAACLTLGEPDDRYQDNVAFDMEASAFMGTAARFSSVELIQLIKIISDSDEFSIDNIDKKKVTLLIAKNMSEIDAVVTVLRSEASTIDTYYSDQAVYKQMLERWHFSEYQKNALKRIVQQSFALGKTIDLQAYGEIKTSKQLLQLMSEQISQANINFD